MPLLHHLRTHADEHRGTESKPYDEPEFHYTLERFDRTTSGITTIASSGLRFLENCVPFGEEIVCTFQTPQACVELSNFECSRTLQSLKTAAT